MGILGVHVVKGGREPLAREMQCALVATRAELRLRERQARGLGGGDAALEGSACIARTRRSSSGEYRRRPPPVRAGSRSLAALPGSKELRTHAGPAAELADPQGVDVIAALYSFCTEVWKDTGASPAKLSRP